MKILLDMPVSIKLADWLRSKGYDTAHLRERNLQTLPDKEVLKLARQEKRILVSMDLDFPQLIATQALEWPSLILFRLRNPVPEKVGDLLEYILENYAEELEKGVILSVTETYIRIRDLPIFG